jgi:hypothetical protein
VIAEIETPVSQFPIPRNHYRFRSPLTQIFLAPGQGTRDILELVHARSQRPQDQQERLWIRVSTLLPHIQVIRLNPVQTGELEELGMVQNPSPWI